MIKCQNECPDGKGQVCCAECEVSDCNSACQDEPDSCGFSIFEETSQREVFQTSAAEVIQSITDICKAKKDLEEKEKTLKSQLLEAMERHNVKSFTGNGLKLTYIAATTAATIDSKKLKEKYPQIAAECSKSSPKAAYVKVELK